MHNKLFLLSWLIFLLFPIRCIAAIDNTYCRTYRLGWHFYCDSQPQTTSPAKISKRSPAEYQQQLKQVQQILEQKKARAVIEPTEDNLIDYIRYQNLLANQAGYFSDQWRRVMWSHPELDYTQFRPVSTVGKQTWLEGRHEQEITNLAKINQRYGLFFVYSTTCPYCQKYGEILANLRQKYQLNIVGVSVNGEFLPNWQGNSVILSNQLQKLNITLNRIPITLLFDNEQQSVIVVGYGLLTQDELISRLYILTNIGVGGDY